MAHNYVKRLMVAVIMAMAVACLSPAAMAQGTLTSTCTPGSGCTAADGSAGICDSAGDCISSSTSSGSCTPGISCTLSDGSTGSCDSSGNCVPGGNTDAPICNTDFKPVAPPVGQGIFSSIIGQVLTLLNGLAYNMFMGITTNGDFQTAVSAIITLYIAVYGILFTFGMVQITIHDFAVRLIKIAIVSTLIGGTEAWALFNSTVIPFFQQSIFTILNWVVAIPVGGVEAPMPAGCPSYTNGQIDPSCLLPPLYVLDQAVAFAVSPNMLVLLIATFTTLPYGPIIGLLLLMAAKTFLKMLINALMVLVMALAMQTVLFGIAPLVIAGMLFERTKHLFHGLINQLLNCLLQPVFLFTFIGFFITLILSCLNAFLALKICQTDVPQVFNGAPFGTKGWRFAINGMPASNVEWTLMGPNVAGQPIFPIPILLVLVFWILVDLCDRSVDVAIDIAKRLSDASIDLRAGGEGLASSFSSLTGGGAEAAGGAAEGASEAASGAAGGNPVPGPGGSAGDGSTAAAFGRERVPGVGVRNDGPDGMA